MKIKLTLEVYGIAAEDAPPPPDNKGLYMWSNGQFCTYYTREAAQAMIDQNQALKPYAGMPGATVRELGTQEVEVEILDKDMPPPVGCLHCSWEGERVYKLCKECLARYIKTALTNRETRLGRDGG
jgi:hypothetical protein